MALPESILRRLAEGEVDEKSRLRREIAADTEAYLAAGGTITVVAFGVSGEVIRCFNRSELLEHHKQRTRKIRGTCDHR